MKGHARTVYRSGARERETRRDSERERDCKRAIFSRIMGTPRPRSARMGKKQSLSRFRDLEKLGGVLQ